MVLTHFHTQAHGIISVSEGSLEGKENYLFHKATLLILPQLSIVVEEPFPRDFLWSSNNKTFGY